MAAERFNSRGRDCVVCFRKNSLIPSRLDAKILRCFGCETSFREVSPDTLERLPFTYSEPIDMVCQVCGAKHCAGHPQEQGVGR